MLIHIPPVINNFKSFERHEPQAIDSSALMEYKRCPLAYFFRYVLGYTAGEEPIYFVWGRAYHRYREVLELEYKKADGNNNSLDAFSATALTEALKLWGATRNPLPDSKFAHVTKERLIHACIEGHKHWKAEKLRGNIIVLHTEQPFNIELPNGIRTSGRFDQVVLWNGRLWGKDFKTTSKDWKYFQRVLWPSDQFARYTYAEQALTGKTVAGQIVEAVVNRAPTQKEDRLPTIESKIIPINPEQLEIWLGEQKYWDDALKWSRDNDIYPKNEKSCSWCQFHQICQAPTKMAQEIILKNKYKKEIWDNAYESEEA